MILQAASNKAEESFTKMSDAEAQAVQGRVDVISYSVKAEINNFNMHRVGDFKAMMQKYLQGQIAFYQNVSWCVGVGVRVCVRMLIYTEHLPETDHQTEER